MTETSPATVEPTKESFRDRIAELFEEMWEKIGQHHHGISGRAVHKVDPDTDLSENQNVLTYTLELAGMDENDVEVLTEAGRLIVRGEKKDEREERGENYVFRERRFGSFERSFALPGNAKPAEIQARLKKGILTITVPCATASDGGVRKIKVTRD